MIAEGFNEGSLIFHIMCHLLRRDRLRLDRVDGVYEGSGPVLGGKQTEEHEDTCKRKHDGSESHKLQQVFHCHIYVLEVFLIWVCNGIFLMRAVKRCILTVSTVANHKRQSIVFCTFI